MQIRCDETFHFPELSGCEGFLQVLPVGSKVITEGQEQRQAEKHGWFAAVGGGDGIRGRKRPTATGRGFAGKIHHEEGVTVASG